MKKAIYLLLLLMTGVSTLASVIEVDGLQKQTTEYEQEIESLKSSIDELNTTIKEKDAENYKLTAENEVNTAKITELAEVISSKNESIYDLREQLKLQQEKEAKAIEENLVVVFDRNDVTKPSNLTSSKLSKALKGTALEQLADTYVRLEKETGINALFLSALTAWESNWGKSNFAVNLNNIGGVKNPDGNGYRYFASKSLCLEYMANFLSASYLNPNGKYYNGKSVAGISVNYNFGSESWVNGIVNVAEGLVLKAR